MIIDNPDFEPARRLAFARHVTAELRVILARSQARKDASPDVGYLADFLKSQLEPTTEGK